MAALDPTGVDLCVGTTDGDTLGITFPPDYTEREITIDTPVELTEGVRYAIVVRALDGDADNYAAWRPESGAGTYENGSYITSDDAGVSWTQQTGYDLWFTTKALAVEKDVHNPAAAGGFGCHGDVWICQTFVASSTYTISSIILLLARKNTPGTVTVSIRATVGAPTKAKTPAPGNAATTVTLDQATLTWEDGGGAVSYDVYYGDNAAAVAAADNTDETGIYLGNQAGLSYTVTGITLGAPYAYLVSRYWRIDSVNAAGTTTGTAWSFTTISLKPPAVTYFYPTGDYYYKLLVQADGSYGDIPGVGVEDTDYVVVGYLPNFMSTTRKMVGAADNKIFIEDL